MKSFRWRAINKAEKRLNYHNWKVMNAEEMYGLKCIKCQKTRKYFLVF